MQFHQIVGVIVLLCTYCNVDAYSTQSSPTSSSCQKQQHQMNRLTFLQKAAGATTLATFTNLNPAQAKEIDPALKGTKNDPAYQACLSKCIYECTKPKADEQRSRAECLPECKQKCATSKEQLMLGTPIQKS